MPPSKQVVYPHQFGHGLGVANLTSQYRGPAVQGVLSFTEGLNDSVKLYLPCCIRWRTTEISQGRSIRKKHYGRSPDAMCTEFQSIFRPFHGKKSS
jgi:hypothetical protein